MLPASSLIDHLETAHGVFLREPNFYYEKKESRFIFNKSLVKISEHDVERRQRRKTVSWTNWLSIQNPNKVIFAVHFLFHTDLRLAKAFVKILGSKFEAMNYKYAIKKILYLEITTSKIKSNLWMIEKRMCLSPMPV